MEYKSQIHFERKNVDMDERTFSGYAATWDKDLVNDIIHKGAFTHSINTAFPAGRIKTLWQHYDPLGMPVEMREDDRGLFVKSRVSKTTLGDEALELMRDGVVDRMSIGFSIPKNKSFFDDDGNRHIKEIKLFEFSPVTFPANENATINSVKALEERLVFARDSGLDVQPLVKALDDLKTALLADDPQSSHTEQQPQLENLKNSLLEFRNILTGG